MPLDPATLDAMVAAGLSTEQIIAVVKAQAVADAGAVEAKQERRRQQTAERVRKHRVTHGNACNERNALPTLPPSAPPDGPPPPPAPPPPPLNPPANPGSDPDGSAADDGGEPGSAAVGALDDRIAHRRELLTRGVDAICSNTGRSQRSARALIGHWLGLARDEAVAVLAVIDEADGRELADFSQWVEARLRRRRDEFDRPPERGRGPPAAPRPGTLAARLVNLHEHRRERHDAEPAADADPPDPEPAHGEGRGVAWVSGGGPEPSDAVLRAAGEGGNDHRAASALRRARTP